MNSLMALVLSFAYGTAGAATFEDHGHDLIIAERFRDVENAAATQARSTDSGRVALSRRLQAAVLLIDSDIAQFRLRDASAWTAIDSAIELTKALYGDHSRKLARLLAVRAMRDDALAAMDSTRKEKYGNPDEALAQSQALLDTGTDEATPADTAYVQMAIALRAASKGNSKETEARLTKATAALQGRNSSWEQTQFAIYSGILSAYQLKNGDVGGLNRAQAAADLARRVAGPTSLPYMTTLAYLGTVQRIKGDYLNARTSLESAIAIFNAHSGIDPTAIRLARSGLASSLTYLGDFDAARTAFKQLVASEENETTDTYSKWIPGYLNDFGNLESVAGNNEHAMALFEKALAIAEKMYGTQKNQDFILPLTHLGEISLEQKKPAEAEKYFTRALDIARANGGGLQEINAKEGLGMVALTKGDFASADTIFSDAVSALRERFGESYPFLGVMRCFQALAEARMGLTDKAYDLGIVGENFRLGVLRHFVPALGEREALKFKGYWPDNSGLLLALIQGTRDSKKVLAVWDIVANSRGLATRLTAIRLEAVRNSTSAEERKLWDAWQSAARSYGDMLMKRNERADAVEAALAAVEHAELDLASSSSVGRQLSEKRRSVADLLAALPADESIVSFISVPNFDIAATARTAFPEGKQLYAFVRDSNSLRLVSLGDNAQINAKVARWTELLRDPGSDIIELSQAGRAVRRAVWDPLGLPNRPARVLIVPDGAIFRINFAALPDGAGYVVERGWRVHTLDHESDLAAVEAVGESRGMLLVGAPTFGQYHKTQKLDLCGSGFRQLTGTKREIDRLAHMWMDVHHVPALVLVGAEATKKALLADAAASDILHIATHAFELHDGCAPSGSTRGVTLRPAASSGGSQRQGDAALALAGANGYLTSLDTEGILTSEEIVTMPLDRTRWVVLAACDTGLGEVVDGEGIFGLRRAFRIAGARTTIMSLWSVDDLATADWMEQLYRNRLVSKVNVSDAIANADLGVLSSRRAAGLSTHPFFWAAFVASGDWH